MLNKVRRDLPGSARRAARHDRVASLTVGCSINKGQQVDRAGPVALEAHDTPTQACVLRHTPARTLIAGCRYVDARVAVEVPAAVGHGDRIAHGPCRSQAAEKALNG